MSISYSILQIIAPQKKGPLKTFQEYTKMTGDTELSLDLGDSLDDKVWLSFINLSEQRPFYGTIHVSDFNI